MAVAMLSAPCAKASILIGTFVTPHVETISQINQLIGDYNLDFNTSLPSVQELLDKLEGQDSADFEEGILELSDFDFYQQDNNGTTDVDIFDANVSFSASTLGAADGFDTLDNPVFAFKQLSGPLFDYYVSKDGVAGWSLWLAMPGINPLYTDAGTGASSLTGSNFTRGNINNDSLDYDPITGGVSHISYYVAIPEPASLGLLLMGLVSLAGRGRRR